MGNYKMDTSATPTISKSTIAFLSDIHLNFINEDKIVELAKKINSFNPTLSVVTGDLSEYPALYDGLDVLTKHLINPMYFIHGNHDFYHSSIAETQNKSFNYSALNNKIKWIGHKNQNPIEIIPDTCLVGVDGLYDGRLGDFYRFPYFEMPDFNLIKDFKLVQYGRNYLKDKIQELADIEIENLRNKIDLAATQYKKIICLMHAPPFAKTSLYLDQQQSPSYSLPFFSNKNMGEMLLNMQEKYPNHELVVLCGHTHYPAELHVDNLHVYVAGAIYHNPEVYSIIDIK